MTHIYIISIDIQSALFIANCFATGLLQYDIIDATSSSKLAKELQDNWMFCHKCSSISISYEQEDYP